LSIWNSIEHYRKFEHSYFKFPTLGKPKTVGRNIKINVHESHI
jgi:hypothetical protein